MPVQPWALETAAGMAQNSPGPLRDRARYRLALHRCAKLSRLGITHLSFIAHPLPSSLDRRGRYAAFRALLFVGGMGHSAPGPNGLKSPDPTKGERCSNCNLGICEDPRHLRDPPLDLELRYVGY